MCHPKVHIDLEFYFIFHHKTIVSNYGCFRLKFKTLPKSLGIILKKKITLWNFWFKQIIFAQNSISLVSLKIMFGNFKF